MPIVKEFVDSAKGLLSWGAAVDRQNRAEIREIVMKLASELNRALSLVILYLEGARGIEDAAQLENYLRGVREKLLDVCNEFHICGALYDLCDRFQRLFDTAWMSVEIGERSQVEQLLGSLRDRERGILDAISGDLWTISFEATGLPRFGQEGRDKVLGLINATISELRKQQVDVTETARSLVDSL